MFGLSKIERLKAKAVRGYTAYHSGHLDCGASMTMHVSPSVRKGAEDYNEAMAELKTLDPNCPKYTPIPID